MEKNPEATETQQVQKMQCMIMEAGGAGISLELRSSGH